MLFSDAVRTIHYSFLQVQHYDSNSREWRFIIAMKAIFMLVCSDYNIL